MAFDTGPGNMVIDAVTERLFGRPYDRDGRIAASGAVLDAVVSEILRAAVFSAQAPENGGTRRVWPGVCSAIHETLRTSAKAGHRRHGDSPDSTLDR